MQYCISIRQISVNKAQYSGLLIDADSKLLKLQKAYRKRTESYLKTPCNLKYFLCANLREFALSLAGARATTTACGVAGSEQCQSDDISVWRESARISLC
jgi:hypothetical protein